jgi:hypothetical protein
MAGLSIPQVAGPELALRQGDGPLVPWLDSAANPALPELVGKMLYRDASRGVEIGRHGRATPFLGDPGPQSTSAPWGDFTLECSLDCASELVFDDAGPSRATAGRFMVDTGSTI